MNNNCGIYCITINNKQYIGSSINIKRRLIQHKSDLINNKHCNQILQNLYNKYLTFDFKILEILDVKNLNELTKKEKEYINRYKPKCNIQDPETNFCVKPVFQFDKSGKLINSYNSCEEAALKLNISVSNIQHAAQENERSTLSAGSFYWSYKKKIKIPKDQRQIPIYVYDISGNYLRTYSSLKECISVLFPKRKYTSIASVVNRITKYKTASLEGYRFSYQLHKQLDNTLLLKIDKNYPIVQLSYDSKKVIKVWENIKSASAELNIKRTYITNAIIHNYRAGNYYWKRLGT
jgi:hypothetical protein